jgi:hypothetical protein
MEQMMKQLMQMQNQMNATTATADVPSGSTATAAVSSGSAADSVIVSRMDTSPKPVSLESDRLSPESLSPPPSPLPEKEASAGPAVVDLAVESLFSPSVEVDADAAMVDAAADYAAKAAHEKRRLQSAEKSPVPPKRQRVGASVGTTEYSASPSKGNSPDAASPSKGKSPDAASPSKGKSPDAASLSKGTSPDTASLSKGTSPDAASLSKGKSPDAVAPSKRKGKEAEKTPDLPSFTRALVKQSCRLLLTEFKHKPLTRGEFTKIKKILILLFGNIRLITETKLRDTHQNDHGEAICDTIKSFFRRALKHTAVLDLFMMEVKSCNLNGFRTLREDPLEQGHFFMLTLWIVAFLSGNLDSFKYPGFYNPKSTLVFPRNLTRFQFYLMTICMNESFMKMKQTQFSKALRLENWLRASNDLLTLNVGLPPLASVSLSNDSLAKRMFDAIDCTDEEEDDPVFTGAVYNNLVMLLTTMFAGNDGCYMITLKECRFLMDKILDVQKTFSLLHKKQPSLGQTLC